MTDGKENSIAGSLSAILDMQKRLVETMGSLQTSVSESRQAIDRVHRDIARMREDQIGLANDMKAMRQEMSDRFVAVGRRFDEVDNSNDAIRGEIRSAQKEIIAQELQTLNAVQEALTVGSRLDDLEASVEEVRGRMGM